MSGYFRRLMKGGQVMVTVIPKEIEHIAIMMDGNGRWAKKRGLPRSAGHFAGMQTMRKIIRDCHDLKLKYVTLYAFSSENWRRPPEEVEYILSLPMKFLDEATLNEFDRNNVRVKFIGDTTKFPKQLIESFFAIEERTKNNNGMVVNFAMNYGGRMEIVNAVKKIVSDNIAPESLTQEVIESYLYTEGQPMPDLIIRTSGEQRISNFLLWQCSSASLWFTKTLWPDFTKTLLLEAIEDCRISR